MAISCLCIGDLHHKVNNIPATTKMNLAILQVAKDKKPDFIVVLGDSLDRFETIHSIPLRQTIQFFRDLSQIAPLYIIIGNHDKINNSDFLTDIHPFTSLHYWPNTYVIDKVLVQTINNHKFVFCPYVYPGRFKEALQTENIDPLISQITAIFAHQEFLGAKMGAICSTVGDPWDPSYPLVISGHIHNYDRLQSNIIYTGTPIQHAFGDSTDKTISFFIFNNEFTEERIDLHLPKKKIIYMNVEEADKLIPDNFNDALDNEIKIVIKGDDILNRNFDKSLLAAELRKRHVILSYKSIPNESGKLLSTPETLTMNFLQKLELSVKAQSSPKLYQTFTDLFSIRS